MKQFFIGLAALFAAFFFYSCEKEIQQEPEPQPSVTRTLRISVPATKLATKALSVDGATLMATWDEDDCVTGMYDGTAILLTPVNPGDASTTLTGEFDVENHPLEVGDEISLLFTGHSRNLLTNYNYSWQLGTLEGLAADYDFATATVSVESIDETEGTIKTTAADFENQQAIVQFTLKDSNGDALTNVISLRIAAASGKIVGCYSDEPQGPMYEELVIGNTDTPINSNEVWVALRNESGAADTYILEATTSDGIYTYIRSNVNFEYGKYYKIGIKMTKQEHTYTVAGNDESVFGTTWDPTNASNDMSLQADGTYLKSYIVEDACELTFKVAQDHSWVSSWPSENYVFKMLGPGTLNIVFNPSDSNVSAYMDDVFTLAGTPEFFFSNWSMTDATNYLEYSQNGYYYRTYYSRDPGSYEFKVVKNYSEWMTKGDNYRFTVPTDSYTDYTFFYDPDANVAVVYPTDTVPFTVAGQSIDDGTGADLVFGTAWATEIEANDMGTTDEIHYEKSYSITHPGTDFTISFKIVFDHSWDSSDTLWGWNAPIGGGDNKDQNIDISITQSGTLKIELNKITRVITTSFTPASQ